MPGAPGGPPIGKPSVGGAQKLSVVYSGLVKAFKNRGIPEAQAAEMAKGAAAQWANESAWGGKASGKNNFFGIKAVGDEPGTAVPTHEVVGGKSVAVMAKFKDYATPEEGIQGYVDFLMKNTRYTKAGLFQSKSSGEYLQRIKNAGYATNPNYVADLQRVMGGATFQKGLQMASAGGAPSPTATGAPFAGGSPPASVAAAAIAAPPSPGPGVMPTPASAITSDTGLRLKSREAIAGGNTSQGLFALAHTLQSSIPEFGTITAMDDAYHHSEKYLAAKKAVGKSGFSEHQTGNAMDFTITDPRQSGQVANKVRSVLSEAGIKGTVIDEYKKKTEGGTGGHIHVNFQNKEESAKFAAVATGNPIPPTATQTQVTGATPGQPEPTGVAAAQAGEPAAGTDIIGQTWNAIKSGALSAGQALSTTQFGLSHLGLPGHQVLAPIYGAGSDYKPQEAPTAAQVSQAGSMLDTVKGRAERPIFRGGITGNVFSGAMQGVTANVSNILKALSGSTISGIAGGLFPGIKGVMDIAQRPFGALTQSIPGVGKALAAAQNPLGALAQSVPGVGKALAAVQNPMGAITQAAPLVGRVMSAVENPLGALAQAAPGVGKAISALPDVGRVLGSIPLPGLGGGTAGAGGAAPTTDWVSSEIERRKAAFAAGKPEAEWGAGSTPALSPATAPPVGAALTDMTMQGKQAEIAASGQNMAANLNIAAIKQGGQPQQAPATTEMPLDIRNPDSSIRELTKALMGYRNELKLEMISVSYIV